MYIKVKWKFAFSFLLASGWFILCFYLSLPWVKDLSSMFGYFIAIGIVIFIALIPGFMYMFNFIAYLIDKRPTCQSIKYYPPISVLIAAYNEQRYIKDTLNSLVAQNYPGLTEIIVADDGSSDKTIEIIESCNIPNLILIKKEHSGKADSINCALKTAKNEIVVCIDGDTILRRDAILKIVQRFLLDPSHTVAVAGTVLVKNSRSTLLSQLQEWDYFISITAIKRIQSLFQGTLVAQGAFSLFQKSIVEELGGWPDTVGEDIVLSWAILKNHYRIGFCEEAIAYTNVPENYHNYFYQRSRWARGLVEAFRGHPEILTTPRLTLFFVYWNLLYPMIDFSYFCLFIPSLILACLGYFLLVGPITLSILPLAFLSNFIIYKRQRRLLNKLGYKSRGSIKSLFLYIFAYQIIMVPATIHGYLSELLYFKKRWK